MDLPSEALIDTNVVILAEHLDPTTLPATLHLCAVSLAELAVGPLVTDDLAERARRQAVLLRASQLGTPLPFDGRAAAAFGRVAADLRAAGRKPTARAFDALIAATAQANGLALATCNPEDFAGIGDLTVVSIPRPAVPQGSA